MTETRQRAMREDVRLARQATRALLPINRRIGEFQAVAARIRGAALHMDPSLKARVRLQIADLDRQIAAQWQQLRDEIGALPDEAREHSRVHDTQRALSSLEIAVAETRRLLGD